MSPKAIRQRWYWQKVFSPFELALHRVFAVVVAVWLTHWMAKNYGFTNSKRCIPAIDQAFRSRGSSLFNKLISLCISVRRNELLSCSIRSKTVYWCYLVSWTEGEDWAANRSICKVQIHTYRGTIHARETYFPREFRLPIIRTKVWTVSSKRYERQPCLSCQEASWLKKGLAAVNNGRSTRGAKRVESEDWRRWLVDRSRANRSENESFLAAATPMSIAKLVPRPTGRCPTNFHRRRSFPRAEREGGGMGKTKKKEKEKKRRRERQEGGGRRRSHPGRCIALPLSVH